MSNQKVKIIFAGTPLFAVPSLKALLAEPNFAVSAVITQPDKKIGRQQLLTPPPIKETAQKHNLPVLQPTRLTEIKEKIKKIAPDLIVVTAYAQIFPTAILNIPRFGCLNVHASLLPKYRGAACVQAAIMNGEEKTGVTIMKMDSDLDTGPILAQNDLTITKTDTTDTLSIKLAQLGAQLLAPTIKKYLTGALKPKPQNNNLASYAPALKKEDGHINWLKSAAEIEKFIRAMTSWPGAFSYLDSKRIKILKAEPTPININKYPPGQLFTHKNNLAVQTGENALLIKKLQLAGKKPITGPDFLRGYQHLLGKILK